MKAMVITEFGSVNVFKQVDIAQPVIQDNQVLINVAATSVNPVDVKIRQGGPYAGMAPDFPAILHSDVAGTVAAVGKYVKKFKEGDLVYGCVGGFKGTSGTLADYITADPDLLAHKPINLSMEEAAALPLVSITAWDALIRAANIRLGQHVLIHGGTGGVGHVAIQLAKACGAVVYTTCSTVEKGSIARQLGADFVINYRDQTVSDYVEQYTNNRGFDVVFDTVGGKTLDESMEAGGLYANIVSILATGTHDLSPAFRKSQTLHTVFMPLPLLTGAGRAKYGEALALMAQLVESGKIKPLLDKQRFSFREVSLAHEYFETGRATGKVVLTSS